MTAGMTTAKELKPGEFIRNVHCSDCGQLMAIAEVRDDGCLMCSKCAEPMPPSVGQGFQGHYDDDLSGASSSWDIAVKLYEDS